MRLLSARMNLRADTTELLIEHEGILRSGPFRREQV